MIDCPHRDGQTCTLANMLLRGHCARDDQVEIDNDAYCRVCQNVSERRADQRPRTLNLATGHLILNIDREDECIQLLTSPVMNAPGSSVRIQPGVGRWFEWLVGLIGFNIEPDCACLKTAVNMNKWGWRSVFHMREILAYVLPEYRRRRPTSRWPDWFLRGATRALIVVAVMLSLVNRTARSSS